MAEADDIALKALANGPQESPLSDAENASAHHAMKSHSSNRTPNEGNGEANAALDPTDADLLDQQQEWDTFLASAVASAQVEAGGNRQYGGEAMTGKLTAVEVGQYSVPGAYAEGPGQDTIEPHSIAFNRLEAGIVYENNAVDDDSPASVDLVTARAVADDGEKRRKEVIPTADPVGLDHNTSTMQQQKARTQMITAAFMLTGLAVIFLVILLILFLGVGIADDSSSDSQAGDYVQSYNNNGNSSRPFLAEAYIKSLLPSYSLEAMDDRPDGPQAKAYKWLSNDPFLFSDNYTNADWRLLQRYALATLFYATSGENWANNDHWLDYSVHECSWIFVESDFLKYKEITELFKIDNPCSEDAESFVSLRLSKNNLQGSLPQELALLSSLESLDVSLNALTGKIPSLTLGKLSSLSLIAMFFNQLSGSFPSSFFSDLSPLPLLYMGLYGNSLTGSIPSDIQNLSYLQGLSIGDNTLSGSLPSEVAMLSQLIYFDFEDNALSNTIPSQLGMLPLLGGIFLRNNALSGTIPSELGLLSVMTTLRLSDNMISGTLPTEMGSLPKMRKLYLNNNWITGQIPSEVGLFTNLKHIFLQQNHLSGSIPSEIALLGRTGELVDFDIRENILVNGTVPEEICGRTFFDCSDQLCGCDCSCP